MFVWDVRVLEYSSSFLVIHLYYRVIGLILVNIGIFICCWLLIFFSNYIKITKFYYYCTLNCNKLWPYCRFILISVSGFFRMRGLTSSLIKGNKEKRAWSINPCFLVKSIWIMLTDLCLLCQTRLKPFPKICF